VNLPFRFFAPRPGYDEILAGLRDQVIEIRTAVRFMEADKPVPQPRDDATGRFVSKRDIVRQQLAEAVSALTEDQREEAKLRASRRPS
jgi:hypothetical protein